MTRIEFYSDRFLPYLPEACQVNPGAYGFELALWLSNALMRLDIVTSYPLGEDWGWFIEYGEGEAEFMIGCDSDAKAQTRTKFSGVICTQAAWAKPTAQIICGYCNLPMTPYPQAIRLC